MDARNPSESITVGNRKPRLLENAVGLDITCVSGRVWLTQYGDARDVVLGPGQRFVATLPTLVVSGAGRDAVLSVRRPASERASPARWLAWLDPRWGSRVTRHLAGRLPG